MSDIKDIFIGIYKEHIARPGSAELLAYLNKSDFFTAPASIKYHSSYEGGLCVHSVLVYEELCRLCAIYPGTNASEESKAIVALLHDLCKVGCYKTEMRNKKEDGKWVEAPYYTFKENFPFGSHGGKSVYMIQHYMRLTPEEAVAINCHMGNYENGNTVGAAYEKYPLAWLLHVADEAATYLREAN